MMQLTDLQQLLADLMTRLDNMRGLDPATTDLTKQLNWAYRTIAEKCCLAGQATFTVTGGQNLYNFADGSSTSLKFILPIGVYINGVPLRNASNQDYGLWKMDELIYRVPTWMQDTTQSDPTRAVMYSYDHILLYQTPSSTTAGYSNNAMFGQYLPADLSAGTDKPDLPEQLHEAVAVLAAFYASMGTASGDDAWTRLKAYNQFWVEIIQNMAAQNRRTMASWGTMSGQYEPDFMFF